MRFTVEWQEFFYNDCDDLDGIRDGTPFEIEADDLNQAKEQAEKESLRMMYAERERRGFTEGMPNTRVIALVGECGTRHQFERRQRLVHTGLAEYADDPRWKRHGNVYYQVRGG